MDPQVVQLVVRMAEENPRWGNVRIVGECRKLGVAVSATSVRTILRTDRLGPAPRRGGPSWTEFLCAQASGTIACDFLTVGLTRLYVLFFIELDRRPFRLAGLIVHPTGAWVAQAAGNLLMELDDAGARFRFLIRDRDRDSEFTGDGDPHASSLAGPRPPLTSQHRRRGSPERRRPARRAGRRPRTGPG